MYFAKNCFTKQTITSIMVGLLSKTPTLYPYVFVIVHAITSVLLLVALPVFFTGFKKKASKKPSSNPYFCAPARLGRLRCCHGFCPTGHYPEKPKNPASTLRTRSAVIPPKLGIPLGTPAKPDAQGGTALFRGLLSSAPFTKAYPLYGLMGRYWLSRFCGLLFK